MKTIDLKSFMKQVEAAAEKRKTENAAVNALRAAHAESLSNLEALRGELEALAAIVAEYEGDDPTEVTPAQFERAITQQRVLAPQLRRAEAEQKRASQAWQEAEKSASWAAQGRRRAIVGEFDKEAAAVRDELAALLQAQI